LVLTYVDFFSSVPVGGIYTVIKTKAPITVEEWGEQFCLMGPYNEACVRTEVEILEPHHYAYKETITAMRAAGIKVRH
jgi:glycogen(starch) synthase